MTLTATIGYHGLEKLSLFAVPLMATLLGVLLYQVLLPESQPAELLQSLPQTEPLGFSMAISLVVAIFIGSAVISPDIGRWAKSPRDAILCGFFGFMFGNIIMTSCAIILAKYAGTEDVIRVMLSLGWGY